jgi:hypothetical protein
MGKGRTELLSGLFLWRVYSPPRFFFLFCWRLILALLYLSTVIAPSHAGTKTANNRPAEENVLHSFAGLVCCGAGLT